MKQRPDVARKYVPTPMMRASMLRAWRTTPRLVATVVASATQARLTTTAVQLCAVHNWRLTAARILHRFDALAAAAAACGLGLWLHHCCGWLPSFRAEATAQRPSNSPRRWQVTITKAGMMRSGTRVAVITCVPVTCASPSTATE